MPFFLSEFNNGGIFAKDQNKWEPWSENFDIKLVIRDGSIKLLSRISSGEMVIILALCKLRMIFFDENLFIKNP